MAYVFRRKTRKGWRYYAEGLLEVDAQGELRRNSKLLLTDGDGHAIESMAQARDGGARLEREAEARADRIRKGLPEPKPPAPAPVALTVNQVADRFLAEYSRPRIKDLEKYRAFARSKFTHYILPALGQKLASDVTRKDVERLRDDILSKRSKQTVVHVLKVISRMYRWARKEGIITCENPTAEVERPSVQLGKPDYYTAGELEKMLATAETMGIGYLKPAVALGAYLGLRLGEICGLRWIDCDLERGLITVARSWATTTKNEEVKTVPANPELVVMLRQWREKCPATKDGLVIAMPRARGKGARAVNPHDMRKVKDLLVAAGVHVPQHYNHALRHAFATLLAAEGTHPVELRELGRWKSMSQVERYAHAMPARLSAQVARLSFAPKLPADIASMDQARRQQMADDHTRHHMEADTATDDAGVALQIAERLGKV